jgi:hypothetical protein
MDRKRDYAARVHRVAVTQITGVVTGRASVLDQNGNNNPEPDGARGARERAF